MDFIPLLSWAAHNPLSALCVVLVIVGIFVLAMVLDLNSDDMPVMPAFTLDDLLRPDLPDDIAIPCLRRLAEHETDPLRQSVIQAELLRRQPALL